MSRADPTVTGRETALVALEVLFLDRGTEPHPVPGVADLLERLAAAARPMILVGATVAGRRLPLAWPKRVAGSEQRPVCATGTSSPTTSPISIDSRALGWRQRPT